MNTFDALKSLLRDGEASAENYAEAHRLLLRLCRHRCALCGGYASSVHEIEPRSTGKSAFALENMLPLCLYHHDLAHATNMKARLREAQVKIIYLYAA